MPELRPVTMFVASFIALALPLHSRAQLPTFDDVGNAVGSAAGGVGQIVDGAGKAAGQIVDGAGKAAGQVVEGAGKAVGQAAEGAGKAVEQAGGNIVREGQRGLENIARESRQALGQPQREIELAAGNVVRTYQKAGADTVATIHKARDDAYATYVKSIEDGAREARKGLEDSIDAVQAAGRFTERQLKATVKNAEKTARRVREGKLVDAGWHWSTDNFGSSEENFFKATQESKLIDQAGAAAAAVYGGPGGAAAYAAWSTYKVTGDPNLAFRAGFIAAASSQAGRYTAKMPAGTMGEVVKKAAMAGAAGGIAVAAAGGDQNAVQAGFLQAGGAVLIQSSKDAIKGYSPTANQVLIFSDCISAKDVDCLSKTTYAKEAGKFLTEHGKPYTKSQNVQAAVITWKKYSAIAEDAKKMAELPNISKLPGLEAIPVLDNKYVLSWTYQDGKPLNTSAPTVVLTQVAQKPPFRYTATYTKSEDLALVAAAEKSSQLQSKPRPQAIRKTQAGNGPAMQASNGNTTAVYICPFKGFNRTVTVTPYGLGCEAWYKSEDEQRTLIWRTDNKRQACLPEARQFIAKKLRPKGLQCRRTA